MENLATMEQQRVTLQGSLDSAKTSRERNQMGQFATPTDLAVEILSRARELLSSNEPVRFLDPAIGTGSFYSALLNVFPSDRIERAEGYEIDPHYGTPATSMWSRTPLQIHLADFTQAEAPKAAGEQFNLLICNPPYVRHHHMTAEEKVRLQHVTEQACGVRIAGLAGLYCYFLGLSHAWMRDDGIAGWLIPSEFMDVNYGRMVKQYLLNQVTLLEIHRFDPNDVQFGDALVSSAVVWFKKQKPLVNHEVIFTYGGSLTAPALSKQIRASDLHHEAKWTRFPSSNVREIATGPRLGDFFSIKRGLATGDNKFFILTRDQIQAHNLPMDFFKPILPSPRYVPTDEILTDKDGTPQVPEPLFLLDCRLHEDEVKERFPTLWTYLQGGIADVASRYLCSKRTPWYSQENRPSSMFVCTYMGRSDKKNGRPFRFILNRSQATAANVYLMLYPKPALAKALTKNGTLAEKVWKILNDITPASMLGEGRVYGGGLHKLEPKELANVPVDEIAKLVAPEQSLANQPDLFKEKVA